MIVDIGHTRDADGVNPFTTPEAARRTMAFCGNRLIHLHLHDFRETDHLAPMDGDIEWGEIFEAFRDIDYKGTVHVRVGVARPDADARSRLRAGQDGGVSAELRGGGTGPHRSGENPPLP